MDPCDYTLNLDWRDPETGEDLALRYYRELDATDATDALDRELDGDAR